MMNTKFAFLILLANTIEPYTDYCTLSKRHLLCKPEPFNEQLIYEQTCGGLRKIPLKETDKSELVKTFNKFRKGAILGVSLFHREKDDGNMKTVMKLIWHDELQKAAETIQCSCPSTPVESESMVFFDEESNTRMQAKQVTLKRLAEKDLFYELFERFKNGDKKLEFSDSMNNTSSGPFTTFFAALAYSESRFIGCARSSPLQNGPSIIIEHCLVMPSEEELTRAKKRTIREIREEVPQIINGNNTPPYTLKDIYKQIDCGQFPNHMLCFNTTILVDYFGNKSACKDVTPLYMRKKEKEELLDIFNTIRMEIATGNSTMALMDGKEIPTAADMMELEWDDDLQELAERTIHNCPDMHPFQFQMSFGKMLEDFVNPVTMLLTIGTTSNPHLREAYSQIIAGEAAQFDIKNLDKYVWNDSYDALTIAAYAKSRYVGCARISPAYFKNKRFEYSDQCVMVPSEYKESPNWPPERKKEAGIYHPEQSTNNLFIEGEPCTQCPLGSMCSTKYIGLCKSIPNQYGGLERPNKYCNQETKHVFCNLNLFLGDEPCEDYEHWNMTEERIRSILDVYNQLRREVAYETSKVKDNLKPAADMVKMEWDYELQRAAELILYNCVDVNEENMKTLRFGSNSEIQGNAFFLNYTEDKYSETIDEELREHSKSFDWNKFENYRANASYKFMTTILKSDTRYIGCAAILTSYIESIKKHGLFSLCIVAAHENDANNTLYSVGPPCTRCPNGFECDDGLCKRSPEDGGIERPDNYCTLSSKHILCQEWDSQTELGDEKACKGIKRLTITDKESKELISSYNQIRSCLAKNTNCTTKSLNWNEDLQKVAKSILYSCIPGNKVTPEMLLFGRHGELQAEAIFLHHNGSNFNEQLKIAIGNSKTFKTFFASDATILGCARTAPRNSLEEFSEVCVLGLINKEKEDGKCTPCPKGPSSPFCEEILEFCFDGPKNNSFRPSIKVLTTNQLESELTSSTTEPTITAPEITSADKSPDITVPITTETSTTTTTTTTTTIRPVQIVQQGELFEPDEFNFQPDLILIPGQPSSPPTSTTEASNMDALTSKSGFTKIQISLIIVFLLPMLWLVCLSY